MAYLFPFGQELHPLVQEDRTPKKVFVLGAHSEKWCNAHREWEKAKK